MLSSFLPNNSKSLTHYKIKRKGGNTDLSKGGVKHRGTTNYQGAKRYLGGQGTSEAWRNNETPRNNKTKEE